MLVIVLLYVSAGQALPSPELDKFLQEKEEGHKMSEIESAFTQWQNGWDRSLKVECPSGRAFYRVKSQHSNGREDRQWEWLCGSVLGTVGKCVWSGYVNDWDAPLMYMCPTNYLLTGVSSYHDNRREDRRWKFRCCRFSGRSPYNCAVSGWVNGWDGKMDYRTPNGAYLNGAFSYNDNHRE